MSKNKTRNRKRRNRTLRGDCPPGTHASCVKNRKFTSTPAQKRFTTAAKKCKLGKWRHIAGSYQSCVEFVLLGMPRRGDFRPMRLKKGRTVKQEVERLVGPNATKRRKPIPCAKPTPAVKAYCKRATDSKAEAAACVKAFDCGVKKAGKMSKMEAEFRRRAARTDDPIDKGNELFWADTLATTTDYKPPKAARRAPPRGAPAFTPADTSVCDFLKGNPVAYANCVKLAKAGTLNVR